MEDGYDNRIRLTGAAVCIDHGWLAVENIDSPVERLENCGNSRRFKEGDRLTSHSIVRRAAEAVRQ